jgi:hypothetical protein
VSGLESGSAFRGLLRRIGLALSALRRTSHKTLERTGKDMSFEMLIPRERMGTVCAVYNHDVAVDERSQ